MILFNDKIIVIMCGNKGPDNELAINNDELYAKRILEKLEKKEPSETNDNNKNGSAESSVSHFDENDKIFKEKEADLDISVQQPPRGGKIGIRTPGSFHYNGFQDRRFRPLSHLSIFSILFPLSQEKHLDYTYFFPLCQPLFKKFYFL